jgi:hypothetical protein
VTLQDLKRAERYAYVVRDTTKAMYEAAQRALDDLEHAIRKAEREEEKRVPWEEAPEWAMWTAFVHPKRNITKQENNHHEKPIFQMMSPEDSIDKTKHQWFEPLFKGMTFDEQWKELEKLFKQQ